MKRALLMVTIVAAVAVLGQAAAQVTREEFDKLADRLAAAEAKVAACVPKEDFDKLEARVRACEAEIISVEKAVFGAATFKPAAPPAGTEAPPAGEPGRTPAKP
jgi:hypothetical protein